MVMPTESTRPTDPDPSGHLLAKVRAFVIADLDPEERILFAALVAPGVARACLPDDAAPWTAPAALWAMPPLPDSLRHALRADGLFALGLDP